MDTEKVVKRLREFAFSEDEEDLKEATELCMATLEQSTTGDELSEFSAAVRRVFQDTTFEELGKPELMDKYPNRDEMDHLKQGIANTYAAERFLAMLQPLFTSERYQNTLAWLHKEGKEG